MKTGSRMYISVGETLFGRENPQPDFPNLPVCYYMTDKTRTWSFVHVKVVIVISFSQDHHG